MQLYMKKLAKKSFKKNKTIKFAALYGYAYKQNKNTAH